MDSRIVAIATVFCILFAFANADYECNYQPTEDVTRVHLRGPRVQKRSTTFDQPFRAFVHYDSSFTSELNITAQQRVKAVINKLTDFLQSVVKVRRTPSPILLNRDCNDGSFFPTNDEVRPCFDLCSPTTTCGPAIVPSDHLLRCHQCYKQSSLCNITLTDGAGVSDADYIIYITSVTTNCGGSTLAFANFCEMEDDFDRPIAGYINYCPNSITSDRSDDFIFDVTKHEFLHAMGFSASGYRWFRDENGDPRSPRDEFGFLLQNVASNNTVKTVTYTDWETRNGFVNKTVSLIVTPKVVEEGRRHFNCSTLEGVQLEDQGGAGTGSSHWEKRIVESEGMTGVISTHPKFSRLTYALLEDSGWYKMNYSFAEQLVWGRGDGCGYVTGSCGGYIKSQKLKREPIAPFCDYLMRPEDTTESSFGCTIDRSAVSFCNLEERVNITIVCNLEEKVNITIPAIYQYFDSGENFNSSNAMLESIGGPTLSNFCPYQTGALYCNDVKNAAIFGIYVSFFKHVLFADYMHCNQYRI
jgi:leishmanolysin-like peptidase